MKLKKMAELYISFFKIGGLTFGGGLAMLPMLQREVVEARKWCTDEELLDMYAIGQCTPGIIAVNTATYVGYRQAGFLGGVFGTLGVISPSIIIICLGSIHLAELHPSSCRPSCSGRHSDHRLRADAEYRSHHGKERNRG